MQIADPRRFIAIIGAIVVLAVIGGFVLLRGGSGDNSSSATTGKPQPVQVAPARVDTVAAKMQKVTRMRIVTKDPSGTSVRVFDQAAKYVAFFDAKGKLMYLSEGRAQYTAQGACYAKSAVAASDLSAVWQSALPRAAAGLKYDKASDDTLHWTISPKNPPKGFVAPTGEITVGADGRITRAVLGSGANSTTTLAFSYPARVKVVGAPSKLCK